MTQSILTGLRKTAELEALRSGLSFHGLDPDELLIRFFAKLVARNITNVFEVETFVSVANKSLTANFKTSNGIVGLQVYSPRSKSGSFEIKLIDMETQQTELLFIMVSERLTEVVEPSD